MTTTELLTEFNKLIKFFKVECKWLGISNNDWWMDTDVDNAFIYHCNIRKVTSQKSLELKYLGGYFTQHHTFFNRLLFTITSKKDHEFPKILKMLFSGVADVQNFAKRFGHRLWFSGPIKTEEFYQRFRPTPKEVVADILKEWLDGDHDYRKVFKLGERLEKLSDVLPAEAKKAPSNMLYRCLAVGIKKIQNVRKGIPLVLKNRKYSSWTYDIVAAKNFGEDFHTASELSRKGLLVVVLRKEFSNDQILLNVAKTAEFLMPNEYSYLSLAEREKEIIVRNSTDEFKFPLENIYLHLTSGRIWKEF